MERLNEKIDSFGSDMQWMKSALLEWSQAIEQDEQTNALVSKYCKDDEKRAKVWSFHRLVPELQLKITPPSLSL